MKDKLHNVVDDDRSVSEIVGHLQNEIEADNIDFLGVIAIFSDGAYSIAYGGPADPWMKVGGATVLKANILEHAMESARRDPSFSADFHKGSQR